MRMIRYHGKSMQTLMSKIRKELGPNALIVSTEESRGYITIFAAIDENNSTEKCESTLSALKSYLAFHRVPAWIADQLLSQVTSGGELKVILQKLFNKAFTAPPLEEFIANVNRIMVIGPPGVGKTITLTKLAAHAVMENKKIKVITTDRQKSGGYEQIEKLMEPFDASLALIENPILLQRAITESDKDQVVFIDTPGINPFLQNERAKLKDLVDNANATALLVLPAGGDNDTYRELEQAFSEMKPKYMILTQLDLARRLGNVLARSIDSIYPLLAVGQFPEIASLLISTQSQAFAELFLERRESYNENNYTHTKKSVRT